MSTVQAGTPSGGIDDATQRLIDQLQAEEELAARDHSLALSLEAPASRRRRLRHEELIAAQIRPQTKPQSRPQPEAKSETQFEATNQPGQPKLKASEDAELTIVKAQNQLGGLTSPDPTSFTIQIPGQTIDAGVISRVFYNAFHMPAIINRQPVESTTRKCTPCDKDYPDHVVMRFVCGHDHCEDCVSRLLTLCLTDESYFPLQCCGKEVALSAARLYVDGKLYEQFEEKTAEYEIKDKVYCSAPTCSALIKLDHIYRDRATCRRCGSVTCAICKAKAHDGRDCPKDEDTHKVLELAKEQNWKRCPHCGSLVEMTGGCYHMRVSPTSFNRLDTPLTDSRSVAVEKLSGKRLSIAS